MPGFFVFLRSDKSRSSSGKKLSKSAENRVLVHLGNFLSKLRQYFCHFWEV